MTAFFFSGYAKQQTSTVGRKYAVYWQRVKTN